MNRLIILFFLSIICLNLIFAQPDSYSNVVTSDLSKTGLTAYFSIKSIYRGIMIGAEIIDLKNGKSILTDNYIYKWTIRSEEDGKEMTKQSNSSVVFFLLDSGINNFFLVLDVYPLIGSDRPVYTFTQNFVLPEPQIRIVKKSRGFILPFDGQLTSGESLTFNFDNFIFFTDRVVWHFNEVFLSNKKEINIEDLRSKRGIIKLQVFSKGNEKAVDIKSVQIQP